MPVCPNCGNKTADNAIFCDQCGTKLPVAEQPLQEMAVEEPEGGVPTDVFICPACGAENVPGEVFCDVCGEPLEVPEPVPVEAAADEEAVEAETIVEGEMVEAEPVIEEEIVEAEAVVEETVIEEQPVIEEATEALYCPTCGAIVHASDTFCGSCGASLGEAPVEEPIPLEEPIAEEEVIEEIVIEEEPVEEAIVEETVIEEIVFEEEPVEEAVAEQVEEELVEEELACALCGASILPDQAFCASCGAALKPIEEAAPEPATPVTVGGPYLEVVASGAHIPLADQPQILIGRQDDISGIHPEIDLTPHRGEEGGVSRRHAHMLHEGDEWFIVDLDSTNGTLLNGSELEPKTRHALADGDNISLGDVEVIFHAG